MRGKLFCARDRLAVIALWAARVFVVLGAVASLAHAAPTPEIAPRPEWITVIEPLEGSHAASAEDGQHYWLTDFQVRLAADQYEYYSHTANAVTARAGLEEAAKITFEFDPADETLILHSVRVRRGDVETEHLGKITIDVARREADLDDGITTGDLTAFLQIPDVRIGDVVITEATWRSQRNVWPGHFSDSFSLEYSVPVGRVYRRILVPEGERLHVKTLAGADAPKTRKLGPYTEHVWQADNVPGRRGEDEVPVGLDQWAGVSLSNAAAWSDVVNQMAPLYFADLALPPDLADRVRAKIAEEIDPARRITWAARLVQDEIRYVSDSVGLGGHVPRSPSVTMRNGYGDCKDKTVLLIAILRAMGIEARPALTDTEEGYALPNHAPSIDAFDHVVVEVDAFGGPIIIDATQSLQGGVFPQLAQPDFGYVLPLQMDAPATADLRRVVVPTLVEPDYQTKHRFEFPEGAGDVRLTITTERTGRSADSWRDFLDGSSLETKAKDWIEYYARLYPGLRADGAPVADDDRDKNRVKIVETYVLPASDFAQIDDDFEFYAEGIDVDFPDVPASDRVQPLALPFPLYSAHIFEIVDAPNGFQGIDDLETKLGPLTFRIDNSRQGDLITIKYEVISTDRQLPARGVPRYQSEASAFFDWESFSVDFSADAAPGTTPTGSYWLIVGVVGSLFVAALVALAYATMKADDAFTGERALIPTPLGKWLLFSVLSFGLYASFWAFRCWRQVRREGREITPFWRAFFLAFTSFYLWHEARERAGSKTPVAVGVLFALCYLILITLSETDALWVDRTALRLLVSALVALPLLPTAALIIRANAAHEKARIHHARWTVRSWLGLATLTAWAGTITASAYFLPS